MRRLLALLACSLLPACGSRGTVDASDASASPAPMPQATAGRDVLGLLAKVPVVDARMRAALPLDRVTQGYRVAPTAWSRPFATLPRRSVEPTRIDGEGSGIWLEIRPLGLADVPAKEGPRGLVYADVAKDTDLVWIAGNGLAEELRVLRGPEAPSVARWKLGRGPGVPSLRLHDGRIEALDAAGKVRLAAEAPFAVDAKGVRRALSLELVDEAGEATLSAALDTAGLAYPIVVDPLWMNAAGVLPATYYEGSGALLPSGKVAIFGSGTKVVQIFDTSTRTFSTGSPLLVSRVLPPSFVLGSGKVLLAGDSVAPNAELWSETGSIATGPASTTRAETVPVHVGFGTGAEAVYFFGGRPTKGSGTILATAEKYVVSTGLFVSLASLPAGRFGSANALLADGKILVAGGSGSAGQFDTGLLYDPGSNTYESLVSLMPQKQWYPQAIVLSSGKVLIVGGWASSYTPTAKVSIYDPSTKTFAAGPSMAYERIDFGYAKLSGNRHAVFGGHGRLAGVGAGDSLSTVEIYDEGTNSWSAGPSMGSIRERAQTVALGGDRVLVAGGVSGGSYSTTAELFLPDPVTCTVAGPGCANCVDGYCCDRPCTGQCEACDLAGSLGFCDYVVGGPVHGTRPACTPTILCGVGGACQTTCSTDLNCGAGKYCGGGACFTKKAAGVACAANNECSLGFCVDGVCCDTACTGQCVACDNPGKVGTCSNATGPTHGARAACTGGFGCDGTGVCATTCSSSAVCGTAYRCDTGTSTCVLKNDLGAACAAPTDCKSNNCVDGVCCNTACTGNCQACDLAGTLGTCSSVNSGSPHGPRTCSPYGVCSLGACSSTCTDSTQCATGFFCVGGTCTNKKNPGEGCGSGAECKSGFCAAGVCCDRACTAECESCGLAGALGTCKFRPTTDSCGLSGCLGSTLVARGTCSGTDATCKPGTATACPDGLKCAGAALCKTTCTGDADCAVGVCDTGTGKCVPSLDAGVDTGTETGDGAIADTADTSPVDSGATDSGADAPSDTWTTADGAAPTLPSKPEVSEFIRCTKSSECATGHCVDGVCCDTACKERCHSCALLSNPGKCTVEPVGVDLRNECGPSNTCLGTCGGAGECVGSGKGTMCGRNRCTGPATGVGPAYCAGPGASCPGDEAVPFDCSPFVCEPAFGACRNSCATSADCANGFACDTTSRLCVAATTPPVEDGGCAVPAGRSSAQGGVVVALLALAGLLRRRR
ncbi:MAG: hypothetical protein IPJ34_06510 [Myxococcales bacterium]|nr:hypothetical protein [Myxococcales bacterium]